MNELEELRCRLAIVERRQRTVRVICFLAAVLLGVSVLIVRVTAQSQRSNVLRVRGLIIEDERGRARVLLGAPFPAIRERKRQDSTTEAMIFLDENGNDRLTLG